MEASGMEVTVAQNGKKAVDFFAASEKDYFDLNLTLICRILTRKGDNFWLRFSEGLIIIFLWLFERRISIPPLIIAKRLHSRPGGESGSRMSALPNSHRKTKKDLEEKPDGKAECGHC